MKVLLAITFLINDAHIKRWREERRSRVKEKTEGAGEGPKRDKEKEIGGERGEENRGEKED